MRVDSQELPLSAIPLYQLLPCHFGPPRPTLSINLYVKGCIDCTTGAFHMSIPSKSSLLQNEVQILNAKPHKYMYLIGPGGDNVLRPDIADLSNHCPVISLQTLEVWHVPKNKAVQVWLKSTHSFRRQGADKPFSSKLSLSMTLKMGSRSSKSNPFFSMSQRLRCRSLVKIHSFI